MAANEKQEQTANRVECTSHGSFAPWLAQSGGSLAVSTYQAGKVAMIGWDGNRLTLLMRDFDKPMGMAKDGDRLALATRNHVYLLANARPLAYHFLDDEPGRYDGLYLPRAAYFTSDLNIHDLAYDRHGLLAVNTRFSCLARLSQDFSFEPVWTPSFVTDLVPEDRCHLNGLAVVDGEAKYVTALGTTDEAGAWRAKKRDGGVLMDVQSGEIVLSGLSMPHSPRWYDGSLYVLNSGCGELLQVDAQKGTASVVSRLPGYLRGLTFVGPYAIVGMCKIREKHIFGGLPIQERVSKLMCGMAIVDLRTGGHLGMFEFTSGCEELFDIQFLPGMTRPMILNAEKKVIYESVTNPQSGFWLRTSHEIKEGDRQDDGTSPKALASKSAPAVAFLGEEEWPSERPEAASWPR